MVDTDTEKMDGSLYITYALRDSFPRSVTQSLGRYPYEDSKSWPGLPYAVIRREFRALGLYSHELPAPVRHDLRRLSDMYDENLLPADVIAPVGIDENESWTDSAVVTSSNNKRMVEGSRQPGLQASAAPESGEREEQDDTSKSNPLPNETPVTIIDLVGQESGFQNATVSDD